MKPLTGRHGYRLQLLAELQLLALSYPLLYSPHIDALLQDKEEELDSHVWFDKPWHMPAVKALAAILRLATSSEGISTGMFLADLKDLIDASSAPHGITAYELTPGPRVCSRSATSSHLRRVQRLHVLLSAR